MKVKILDVINNVNKKEIELNDEIFNIIPKKHVIYEVIKNELANARQGTACTKTKAEVKGSGAKPWKQKGSGRARVGTKRSPVWRGGGIIFGPKPRDYSYSINKKLKRLAYKSILSLKNKLGDLKIVEVFKLKDNKTKEFFNIFKPILNYEKTTFVFNDTDESSLLVRACKNISWIRTLSCNRLNAHTLYYSKNIVLLEDAAMKLNELLVKK